MENIIRKMLLDYFRETLQGMHLENLNVDVIKVVNFHPFEMYWKDLNNISGLNLGFTCWIDSKIEGADKSKKTYSFSFSGVKANISATNELTSLNFDDLSIPFFNNEG